MGSLLVGVGVVTAGHAQAQTDTSQGDLHACFTWEGSQLDDCPTRAMIQTSVEGILGHPTFIGDRCDLRVTGTTRHTAEHATIIDITFYARSGSMLGQRRLEGNKPNCSAYTGPISLVIALMIESVRLDAKLVEPPASGIRATDPSMLSQASETPSGSTSRQGKRTRTSITVDGRGAWGLLPHASVGIGTALDVAVSEWLPARVEATFWMPSRSRQPGPGGSFWAWQVGIGGYPVTFDGPVRTQLLTGLELGFLYGTGTGLDFTESTRRPYGALALRMKNAIALVGPIDLVTQAGLAIPWLRPDFVYLDPSGSAVSVHRPEQFILEAGMGLSWQWGASSDEQEPAQ